MGDIRDEWKLNDIERKAQQALDKANEIDSLRGNVDSLECSNRELRTEVDELRNGLQAIKDALRQASDY